MVADGAIISSIKKYAWHIFFTVLAGAVIVGIGIIWIAASTSLKAEYALHANLCILYLVRDFLEEHEDWPRSWSDLEKMPAERSGMYEWPGDIERIQKLVEVDFNADLKVLADQTPEEFTAIRPTGVCFVYDYEIDGLLNLIRNMERKKAGKPVMTE